MSVQKVVTFENLKIVSLQSAADTCIWRYCKHTCTSCLAFRKKIENRWNTKQKFNSTRSLKNGTCTDCHKRKSLGNPRTRRDRMRARATFWREKISVQEKISGSARSARKGFDRGIGRGEESVETCRAEREPRFRETDACIPPWNGITYASRYPATGEFERGHLLIRLARLRFSFAREESRVASSERQVYERARGIMNSRSLWLSLSVSSL